MTEGILIVDNSALKHLEQPDAQGRFEANLKAAQWKAWPTAVNFIEAAQNKNEHVRGRTLQTLRWLCGGGGLLPWPAEILRITGQALLDGKDRFEIDWSGLEAHLFESEIEEEHEDAAKRFLDSQQERFDEVHKRVRKPIQQAVKASGLDASQYSPSRFLDEVWGPAAHLDVHLTLLWEHLELPGPPPLDALKRSAPWMLEFDTYGIVAYEQAFLKEQQTRVQLPDLLQLLYLGIRPGKRAVATEDKGFQRAAASVLSGRYPGAEVTPIAPFIK